MKTIKRITIVTAQGVKIYRVGSNRVTQIIEAKKQVSTDVKILFYQVLCGNEILAEISATCPLEIVYKEASL